MASVSILIPCRNAASTIRETLESVLAQEGIDKEVIVVDDGSTDGSVDVAASCEHRGVRVVKGPRTNASAARNHALKESHGDYIQYLDADDLLSPGKIRKQIEVLERNPDCVATARWGRFKHTVSDAVFADDDQLHDWSVSEWLVNHCANHRMMHPAAWLVPRRIIEAAGPWNEDLTLNDDGEYFARVVAQSSGLKYAEGAESFYRTTDRSSLSKRRDSDAFRSLWRSLSATGDTLLGLDSSPRAKEAVADMYQRFFFEVYPSLPEERNEAQRRIARLGGSRVKSDFGPKGRLLALLFGWRAAVLLTRVNRKRSLL